MDGLINLIQTPGTEDWPSRCKAAFSELYSAKGGRYPDRAQRIASPRVPDFKGDIGVPFGALIHPSNPDSGPYGGMSFVVFPTPDVPCLVALVVGTQGLSPDEEILARPGHARKVGAICAWLNHRYGKGKLCAWAKQDPVRTDLDVPPGKASHPMAQFSKGMGKCFTAFSLQQKTLMQPSTRPRRFSI
jgi:5-methylcytosine-specific restriction protein B